MKTTPSPGLRAVTYLACALVLIAGMPRALAGMAGSTPVTDSMVESQRATDLAAVQQVLERKLVQDRLGQLGYDAEDVQQRVERLDADELHQLAQNIEQTETAGVHGVLIAVLLILLIIGLVYHLHPHHT